MFRAKDILDYTLTVNSSSSRRAALLFNDVDHAVIYYGGNDQDRILDPGIILTSKPKIKLKAAVDKTDLFNKKDINIENENIKTYYDSQLIVEKFNKNIVTKNTEIDSFEFKDERILIKGYRPQYYRPALIDKTFYSNERRIPAFYFDLSEDSIKLNYFLNLMSKSDSIQIITKLAKINAMSVMNKKDEAEKEERLQYLISLPKENLLVDNLWDMNRKGLFNVHDYKGLSVEGSNMMEVTKNFVDTVGYDNLDSTKKILFKMATWDSKESFIFWKTKNKQEQYDKITSMFDEQFMN